MIEINNLTKFNLDEKEIKEIIKKVLENGFKNADLSIAFVKLGIIKNLNKRYRNKNQATDVLSFSGVEKTEKKFKIKKTEKNKYLGEIIICPEEVLKNSKEFKSGFEKEINKVLIHGVLHLLGYEHEGSKQKAEAMEKKQSYYFKNIINK